MKILSFFRIVKILVKGYKVYREMNLSPEKRQRKINERFLKLVKRSADRTWFYNEQFQKHHINPNEIKSIHDIQKLPVTTKNQLREHSNGVTTRLLDRKHAIKMATSGSTGVPTTVYRDDNWIADFIGTLLFFKKMHKIQSVRIGLILDVSAENSIESKMVSFGKYLTKHALILDVRRNIADMMDELEKSDINYMITYPGVMRELANLRMAGRGQNLSLKKIFVSGEILDDYTRDRIEKAFGCPCYSVYISTEGGFIAGECEQKHMHVFSNTVHVEVVDNDGVPVKNGETGTIVFTGLDDGNGTKVIRYNGCADAGTLLDIECDCGLKTPVLGPILGRKIDAIHLRNGQIYHPFTMTCLMEKIQREHGKDRIRQYQIVQESQDRITINLVRNKQLMLKNENMDELKNVIRNTYQDWAKNSIDIAVEEVPDIQKGRNTGMPTPLVISKLHFKSAPLF